ncbi:MAG: phosphopantothenoylcysteine decarboxylase [Planctomycetes bacterium]|nr:phosphopantothenoylcysteine decarboxylase [Planctomycetota bacterium]
MNILITAGGTREYIDPVRFITNASSGKMGYALARAAIRAGHKVILITAPTKLRKPTEAKIVEVKTSAQMFDAVKKHFPKSKCLIMAAAVSDYKPAKQSKTKIKKTAAELIIKLKPTQDILKWAGGHKKKNQVLVGFALEDKDLKTNSEIKLRNKKLDMVIANQPTAIEANKSTVHIKTKDTGWVTLSNKSKAMTAKKIIQLAEKL